MKPSKLQNDKNKIENSKTVDEGNNDCLDKFEKFLRKNKEEQK